MNLPAHLEPQARALRTAMLQEIDQKHNLEVHGARLEYLSDLSRDRRLAILFEHQTGSEL